jgi:hypothetical protein
MEWAKALSILADIAERSEITDGDLTDAFDLVSTRHNLRRDITAAERMTSRFCPSDRRDRAGLSYLPPEHRREFVLLLRDAPIDPTSPFLQLAAMIEYGPAREVTAHEIDRATWQVRAYTQQRRAIRELITKYAGPRLRGSSERTIPVDRRRDYIAALLRIIDQ